MEKNRKILMISALLIFAGSTLFFLRTNPVWNLADVWIDEKELGELCIGQVAPAAGRQIQTAEKEQEADPEAQTESMIEQIGETAEQVQNESETDLQQKQSAKKKEQTALSKDPLVIIYHTHSTESYLPYKESNYHREKQKGTVRDVGEVLKEALEEKGIRTIHDTTLHDRPSYNESYSRSLQTIQTLRKKYPTAKYVIDLHRDAAAASAKEGKLLTIDQKRVAKFSLVVGKENQNYAELYEFAKKVSQKAEQQHKGFGGAIIEQNYRYNEFVSDYALLLEIGNNKNTIEESRRCAKYFAEALAAVIK